jgi:hypothetical protein
MDVVWIAILLALVAAPAGLVVYCASLKERQ